MKVIVKFDEAKYTDIPFELDERQLNTLRVLLGHYTGPGCRVEFEVEQKRPIEAIGAARTCRPDVLDGMPKKTASGDGPTVYTAEELGKVMADPADTLGFCEEVLENE